MRSVPDNDALHLIERFVLELRAIERWDAGQWGTGPPEAYEMLAFVARRKRRAEILAQLLTLIPRLDDKEEGLPCLSGKSSQRTERTTGLKEAQVGSGSDAPGDEAVPIRGKQVCSIFVTRKGQPVLTRRTSSSILPFADPGARGHP
jgi:hypothetical protein